MPDFLLELGLEEIPARMIASAQAELAANVAALLVRERLIPPENADTVTSYSTPRRLAVLVSDVAAQQAGSEEQMVGPSAKIAFKDGQPTPAAMAFAKKAGVEVSALTTLTNAKGEYVTANVKKAGREAADLLAELLPAEISKLNWAKSMYWRPGKPERMVRPLRWMVALLGEAVVPLTYAGVAAAAQSFGHRILYGPQPVPIDSPARYAELLEAAFVQPDPEQRRHVIRKALDSATRQVAGARWREDEPLVDTCVHLTEWPSVVLGNFEQKFLALPQEVLVTVMRDHQKYFAVEDAQGRLAPHFLAVLNTKVDAEGAETIRHGNARVLRARFSDAEFFWTFDQKVLLTERVELLKTVTFQKKLGSYWDKTQANIRLAEAIAVYLQGTGTQLDLAAIRQAATLAKTDLTAELVKEFTELQGVVGGLYAAAQGVPQLAADAIYDQYSPAAMDDPGPRSAEGAVLGLADRANTIVDMFAVGLAPTGSKDPFALRRGANGVIKILADSQLPITLPQLISLAVEHSSQPTAAAQREAVAPFLRERLSYYLREISRLEYDVINAVVAAGADDVRDAIARGNALARVRGTADFVAISGAFKRIKNILAQAAAKGDKPSATVDEPQLKEPAERSLYDAAEKISPQVETFRRNADYASALDTIATLRPAVDAFFDSVMVMAPDEAIRKNRLALLSGLLADFSRIADFSGMVTTG